ncbi:hypothetical protein GOBAR_DD24276 [Gossypium barbadense]|nr:hypothetical protein GOBAR_DD24276 [Gossypium barbadense]
MAFDPTQAYPSVVMAWIRFLALPSYLYNRKVITEIEKLVRKVVKLDMNTDSRAMGRFARMVVYVNLEKTLVSQILINGRSQKVEYESLSTICFHCESCSRTLAAEEVPSNSIKGVAIHVKGQPSAYRPPLTLKGYDKEEVVMEVGSLDSGKHLAVIFLGNKNANNINNALSINNSLVSVQEGFSSSGKRNKIRGKSTVNKHNKILHGRNVRFKNSGSQHVSIKKSMEQLTKSISAFFKDNFDSGNSTINDEQQERVNLL